MNHNEQDISQMALHPMGAHSLYCCRYADPYGSDLTKGEPHWFRIAIDGSDCLIHP